MPTKKSELFQDRPTVYLKSFFQKRQNNFILILIRQPASNYSLKKKKIASLCKVLKREVLLKIFQVAAKQKIC